MTEGAWMRWVAAVALLAALVMAAGCATTQWPDGRQETRVDVAATVALIELAVQTIEQGVELWARLHPEATPEELAAEQARADRRAATLRQVIETLNREWVARQ